METLKRVVRAEGFRKLVAAQFVSSLGDWLATFALMALVLDISGSAAAVGGVLALRMLPAAVAGPLIGAVGRRWGRRPLLVGLDATRAGLVMAVPLVRSLVWVYSLALLIEAATVLAITARDASIRDTVDRQLLPAADGIVLGVTYAGIPLGAAGFAGLVSLAGTAGTGYTLAFWADAATFVLSMLVIRTIRQIPDRPDLVRSSASHVRLRDVLDVPEVRSTLPSVFAASVGIGTMFSLGIPYVRDSLGASDAQFGVMVITFGIGAVVGLAARQAIGGAGVKPITWGVAALGAVQVLMGVAPNVLLAHVMAVVFGAAGAFAIVSGLTFLQVRLDSADQLLALGGFHLGVRIALSIGALAAGVAADLAGRSGLLVAPTRVAMMISGAIVLTSTVFMGSAAR